MEIITPSATNFFIKILLLVNICSEAWTSKTCGKCGSINKNLNGFIIDYKT